MVCTWSNFPCLTASWSCRHHRYIFEEKESKAEAAQPGRPKAAVVARMQELGPRFTLKLQSLQKGTFDSKHGEFEWVHKKEMDTSRRRFHL
jgi:ribosome production factor 1